MRNNTTTLPLTLLLLLSLLLPIANPDPNPNLIFILAGQSNMSGRGGVLANRWDGFVPPQCRPTPSVLRLDAALRWSQAKEPLHYDIDVGGTCGVGPGLPFAHFFLRSAVARGDVVGLVPCAVGGTRIAQWERGTDLYQRLVTRTRAAMGSGGRVGAVLWYQGESDAVAIGDARAYKGRMERFVGDLRADLGLPNLLFIQVALASGMGKYTQIVRNAQKSIRLANFISVDAHGLQLEPDHVHLATQAQVQLGQMLAAAYLNKVRELPNH